MKSIVAICLIALAILSQTEARWKPCKPRTTRPPQSTQTSGQLPQTPDGNGRCPDEFDPVCACENNSCQTFTNECYMRLAIINNHQNFDVAIRGDCLGGKPVGTGPSII